MLATLRVRAASAASAVRPLARALAELVWPPRCAGCREPTEVEPFCPACAEALLPVPPGCVRCGLPGPERPRANPLPSPARPIHVAALRCSSLRYQRGILGRRALPSSCLDRPARSGDSLTASERFCGACLAAPPAFASVQAAGLFGGPLADAIHALKYGDRPALARPLGEWLAGRVALPSTAAILSLPLGRGRRIERGYDQAALLADELASAAGRSRDRLRGVLRRVRETPPQVGRGRAERVRNVRGAFWASGAIEGCEAVLVDDVVTTGATADAAARALLEAGATRVDVVALARAE